MPVTTLRALCEQHAPASFEFLKIDVEGAEDDVIRGGDWKRFRPKVVVIEALAPYSLAPAWDSREPILTAHGYRYARFDSLNRYYVAEEEADILQRLTTAPDTFRRGAVPRCEAGARSRQPSRPPAGLALAKADMIRLPVIDRQTLVALLTASLPAESLDAARERYRYRGSAASACWTHSTTGMDSRIAPAAESHDSRSLCAGRGNGPFPGRLRAHQRQLRVVTRLLSDHACLSCG